MNLVVGASGMVGAALLHELRRRGLRAEGTSRLGGGGLLSLDLSRPSEAAIPREVRTAFLCGGVTSLAACAADPRGTSGINVRGIAGLASALADAGARVVFLSSSLVFSGTKASASSTIDPCCEYGSQKALAEAMLPRGSAVVRLTKIVESLRDRFGAWRVELASGRRIPASPDLRFAPLPLAAVAGFLADFATGFEAGVFQMSPPDDLSYYEAASALARKAKAPGGLIVAESGPGLDVYWRLPREAAMVACAPVSSDWRFSSAEGILNDFLNREALGAPNE